MADEIIAMQRQIERLATLVETEAARCPHRESIRRAENNLAQIEALNRKIEEIESTMADMRVELAKIAAIGGASGGGVAAAIAGIILAIMKAAGIL